MQSPVPWQDVCMQSAASSQAGWEMGKGEPAWAEAVGTAEQLCSGSCDSPGHSCLGRTLPGGLTNCQSGTLPVPCISRVRWGLASSPLSYQTCRWKAVGLEVELWPLVCQSEPFQKGMSPALGFAGVHLLTLMGWGCVILDHRVRQYFVTASLEEFWITAEPTEKYLPCKEDIEFLKQLVL